MALGKPKRSSRRLATPLAVHPTAAPEPAPQAKRQWRVGTTASANEAPWC